MRRLLFLLLSFALMLSVVAPAMGAGANGTSLKATVGIGATNTKTYDWAISKGVDQSEIDVDRGETETVTYQVVLDKRTTTITQLSGCIAVSNTGDVPTENLAITVDLSVPPSTVSLASMTLTGLGVLQPGGSDCYDYAFAAPAIQLNPGTNYKVTAAVTITNHSGSLGTPKGANPSNTMIMPTQTVHGYDAVTVSDTNGMGWAFGDSGAETYQMALGCENGEAYQNTATINETGQHASAVVAIRCHEKKSTKITAMKFYDLNGNGMMNGAPYEYLIAGWQFKLNDGDWVTADSSGQVTFTDLPDDGSVYTVTGRPLAGWKSTTPTVQLVSPTGPDGAVVAFGDRCLSAAQEGSMGFWTNKNGQALVTAADLAHLNSLPLFKKPTGGFTSSAALASWLKSATATDMAYMLSAQLAAAELNVRHGRSSGAAIIVRPGYQVYGSVSDLLVAGRSALATNATRASQESLKNLLEPLNTARLELVNPLGACSINW